MRCEIVDPKLINKVLADQTYGIYSYEYENTGMRNRSEYRFDAVADALNELALLAHRGHEVGGRLVRVERGRELPRGAVERASEALSLCANTCTLETRRASESGRSNSNVGGL